MPTFRCEFDVRGDLVLKKGTHELQLSSKAGYTTKFRNGPVDSEGHATGLVAIVIGTAESIDTAKDELRQALAKQLDLLSFSTQSRFKILAPRRLIAWDANQKEYQYKIFHTVDSRYPPSPELIQEFLETVQALDQVTPAFTRTALKYFRYGLLDDLPEDQFMRLWLSLEILAENEKEKKQVQLTCSKCSAVMKCSACGFEPIRIPMAKQAIENLITKITGTDAPDVIKRQFIARNSLMHGGSPRSTEKECKMPLSVIVNELGAVTWEAILSTIPLGAGAPPAFGHRDGEFTNESLVTALLGSFDHNHIDGGPYPAEDKIPTVKITMLTTFNSPVDEDELTK